MRILMAAALMVFFAQGAWAQTTYICTHEGSERIIEVVYLGETTVPCEVRYTRDGVTEVLWRARFEEGFCDVRAAGFVERQQGWGWECVKREVDPLEPAALDTPEVLEPDPENEPEL